MYIEYRDGLNNFDGIFIRTSFCEKVNDTHIKCILLSNGLPQKTYMLYGKLSNLNNDILLKTYSEGEKDLLKKDYSEIKKRLWQGEHGFYSLDEPI